MTKIHPTAVLLERNANGKKINIKIGEDVEIGPLTTIGSNPFIYKRGERQVLHWQDPDERDIVIEDNVTIGSNCSIEYPCRIREDVKIDNLVLVGHHSDIGEHSLIAGMTLIAGHVTIGPYTLIGVGVTTKPKIRIGKNVLVGAGAMVTKDVPDNAVVAGIPARVVRMKEA